MITALELGQPECVPTFELVFQLTEELTGIPYMREGALKGLSATEKAFKIDQAAEAIAKTALQLKYGGIGTGGWSMASPNTITLVKRVRELVGDQCMVAVHGDATFAIPNGNQMTDFVFRLKDHPEEVHAEAEARVDAVLERAKPLMDAGVDCFMLCADYCFNTGPFLSPKLFAEFVTPYLARNIQGLKDLGAYVIKHTDGNIMPILDQLVACEPHALHSLDPMAGVDIREVKRLVGDKVCLIGNVQCNLLQDGPDEALIDSAEYCLRYGAPGGGYVFSTSNCPFLGMPLRNYMLIWEVWKKWRCYDDRAELDARDWPERSKTGHPSAQAVL
jgi:uroporphyrinogen decarboxylase